MRNAPHPSAHELLQHLAERGDVIAQRAGRVFLLIDLDAEAFDQLAAFGAGAEDLEDEPDDDDQGEPSLNPLHSLDRERIRLRPPP